MLYLYSRRLVTLLHLFGFISFAFAQTSSSNGTDLRQCPADPGVYAKVSSVNSTGTVSFRLGEENSQIDEKPWFFSVTYNDTRRKTTEYVRYNPEVRHSLQGWLSVPPRADGLACVYKFRGVNASSTGNVDNSCEGVISPACIEALGNITMAGRSSEGSSCPDFTSTDEIKAVCGNGTIGTVFSSGQMWTCKSGLPLSLCSND